MVGVGSNLVLIEHIDQKCSDFKVPAKLDELVYGGACFCQHRMIVCRLVR